MTSPKRYLDVPLMTRVCESEKLVSAQSCNEITFRRIASTKGASKSAIRITNERNKGNCAQLLPSYHR